MGEQKQIGIDRDFRAFFCKSKMGPKVLGMMLDDCHFGMPAHDEEWQAAQNFMKIILTKCGINYTGETMVRALIKATRLDDDE